MGGGGGGGLIKYLIKMAKFSKERLDLRDSEPSSWYNFSVDVPLVTPVIAKHALY